MPRVRLARYGRVELLDENRVVGPVPRRRPLRPFEADEGFVVVEIAAQETVEILQLGMPKLSGMTASAGQAAA